MPRKRKEEAEEKTYEVKDKRRVNPDGSLKEEVESPKSKVESPEETEDRRPSTEDRGPSTEDRGLTTEDEELPLPDIYQTLQFMMGLLAEQAWTFMGLRLPPGRKEPMKDMAQAKLAIDSIIYIADKLHPHLDEDSRKALRMLISDLQLNFVQHGQ